MHASGADAPFRPATVRAAPALCRSIPGLAKATKPARSINAFISVDTLVK